MKLKNINGISLSPGKDESWLMHWENVSRWKVGLCPAINCRQQATNGAFVQIVGHENNDWYILPLCSRHGGMTNKEIEVIDTINLVPVRKIAEWENRFSRP